METKVCTFTLLIRRVFVFRAEFKPKKIKTENDKKAKKRKQEDEVSKDLMVWCNTWLLLTTLVYNVNTSTSLFQDIKSKKTKSKKGEAADGKKKTKQEPEEKWKWWVDIF